MRTEKEIKELLDEIENGKILFLPGGYGLNQGFQIGLYYALGYSKERSIIESRLSRKRIIQNFMKEIDVKVKVKVNKKRGRFCP